MKLFNFKIPLNVFAFIWCLLGVFIYSYTYFEDLIRQENNQSIKDFILGIGLYLLCIFYCVKFIEIKIFKYSKT